MVLCVCVETQRVEVVAGSAKEAMDASICQCHTEVRTIIWVPIRGRVPS
jgi:hypothetical protein